MKRKALLVGINDYAPAGKNSTDLRGCLNDVRDVAHTLNALGVVPAGPGSLKILTNYNAKYDDIINGLNWLIKGAKKGDLLIFYFSGHGSQEPDLEGDELEAPPQKDETICPQDSNISAKKMIKDDTLCEIFKNLSTGVNLEVILDCCHSGSGTRDFNVMKTTTAEPQVVYRYMEPPLDYNYFLDANPSIPVKGFLKTAPGGKEKIIAPEMNHVLWAACRENQISAETVLDGVWRGVFTYCFCKVLRRAGLGITRNKLHSLVNADIKGMGYSQVMQLEGKKSSFSEKVFT